MFLHTYHYSDILNSLINKILRFSTWTDEFFITNVHQERIISMEHTIRVTIRSNWYISRDRIIWYHVPSIHTECELIIVEYKYNISHPIGEYISNCSIWYAMTNKFFIFQNIQWCFYQLREVLPTHGFELNKLIV